MDFLFRLFTGFLDRLLAVTLAVAAAQAPVYYAQYLQTLAGVRQEATARYHELQQEAAALRLDVEAFVQRHEQNADPVFQASGRIHRNTLARYQRFERSWQALNAADVWHRPLVMVRHFDPEIDQAVRFRPGLPLDLEGLGWAVAGLLLAGLLSALAGALLRPRPRYRSGQLR